jgi:hypothetical protein
MSDTNPLTGPPSGGRDKMPDDDAVPGEQTTSGENVQPPETRGGHDSGSRAAQGEPMTSDTDSLQPSPGIPTQVDAPSPADATDGSPPGGSVANQDGRAPDQ